MALDFFAGCVGGGAGVLVGHPFDTIKVHLQTQDPRRPLYRGTFHCFKTIVQRESVAGLYRGMTSPMYGVALINAVIFGVYGNVQRRLDDPDSLRSHFYAGGAAGLAQSVVCSPVELAKTRMQVLATENGGGPLRCLLEVLRREGVRGVWRGLGATAVRDSAGIAVYFATYEWLSRRVESRPGAPLPTATVLLVGGTAGTASWLCTFPVDVVKSRLQVDGAGGRQRQYRGFWDCCAQSVRAEGPAFLGRGLVSTLLRAFPTNAATFAAVTWVFRLAGREEAGAAAGRGSESAPSPVVLLWAGGPELARCFAAEPLGTATGLRARYLQVRDASTWGRVATPSPHPWPAPAALPGSAPVPVDDADADADADVSAPDDHTPDADAVVAIATPRPCM